MPKLPKNPLFTENLLKYFHENLKAITAKRAVLIMLSAISFDILTAHLKWSVFSDETHVKSFLILLRLIIVNEIILKLLVLLFQRPIIIYQTLSIFP